MTQTMTTERNTSKLDALVAIEREMKEFWTAEKMFEAEPGTVGQDEKFMGTFPYPYMNGRLHLGHSFSLSKLEFATGFERLLGKKCLFPFGFHCTGMPIKACADKLKREFETYGNPPHFPENVTKGQWHLMKSLGVPEEDIIKFADANYWLTYFPPIAMDDLKSLGLKVDWRRSFITTDVNPYYDRFISWQFRKLKESGRIKYGKRYSIYSPLDGQPCMDHDRQSGEGVKPQEYTLIKMKVTDESVVSKLPAILHGRKVFLAAATLRPETMYGQTNCWVGPDIEYGAFEVTTSNGEECTEVFICTERSAKNMSFQDLTPEFGVINKLCSVKGTELIGLALNAPYAQRYPVIYSLPMMTVSANKGTGIVTSVPSDSPDDFASLRDLKEKAQFREKFSIKDEWVLPFEPIPIIETEKFGNLAAPTICDIKKIRSQNDRDALREAKEEVYKEGFYKGKMCIGEHSGKPVEVAKPLIKAELIEKNHAVIYNEPEGLVMSRSGDECVVALVNQWYLNYGEEEWKKLAKECLDGIECFHEETRNKFVDTLDWLHEWACSRSYGLGTRLPWDPQWLIESLSDSTIYMAYYTIAHYLQGNVNGSEPGIGKIEPEDMTDEVFDYIFTDSSFPIDCSIAKETLDRMKAEFEFYYPLDLRVSGKDLVPNHLTFFIYNHVAIFPKKYWPRGIRSNGHLLLNSEKMSKSTGNFMTLRDAVDKFGADAARIVLADAGDTIDDANFVEAQGDASILRQHALLEFYNEVFQIEGPIASKNGITLRSRDSELNFHDRFFLAEVGLAITNTKQAYQGMLYRDALKYGYYELQNSRDRYREAVKSEGMHERVIKRFCQVQALLLAPIAPHFCDHVWKNVMNLGPSIMHAKWPEVEADEVDRDGILSAGNYLHDLIKQIRSAFLNEVAFRKKKKVDEGINAVEVFVASKFPEWQDACTRILKSFYNSEKKQFENDADLSKCIMKDEVARQGAKKAMPFVKMMQKLVIDGGIEALDRTLSFNEFRVVEENLDFIKKHVDSSNLTNFTLSVAEERSKEEKSAALALPKEPSFRFYIA